MATKKPTKAKAAKAPEPQQDIAQLLNSWQILNKTIGKLTEEECAQLLELEKAGKRRAGFLMRLHGRFNVLRTQRERESLISSLI